MARYKTRREQRRRRHWRLRHKISGTAQRPRLAVCRTTNHLYVQVIDDVAGHTLASISTLDAGMKSESVKANVDGAKVLGRVAAEKLQALGISEVVFDRGGFKYHGQVAAVADAAREAGIKV
jgi:large subunit ribosomal protein L18